MISGATYDNICVLHDYLFLEPNWVDGFQAFGFDWNVCSSPTLDPFRSFGRVADWMTLDHPAFGVSLLPYSVRSESRFMFISGMYYCVKKPFVEQNNLWLDEDLVWGEAEDQEWSRRVRLLPDFSLNTLSVVTTQKPKEFVFLKMPNKKQLRRWRYRTVVQALLRPPATHKSLADK